ncbi:MAG: alginate lyase family protein [Gammaproteobacteria bacterium]
MKLRRILNAGVIGIANRAWQEIWRTFDRMMVAATPDGTQTLHLFEHLAPQPIFGELGTQVCAEERAGVARAALASFRHSASDRFFKGVTDVRAAGYFEKQLPEIPGQIIAAADAICERRFSLLGHHALFMDEHVNWHQNPVSGHRSPLVHWSLINPLDEEALGDTKFIWELNRHQWLVDLGQAYCFSGNERYADVFVAYIKEWMQANRPGVGINWASSLEVSFRMIAWCWALFFFRNSNRITPELYAEMLAWIRTHAAHIEKYLSHYFSPNTHLTGEALGLFYVGVLFPEFQKAERWRHLGSKILLRQLGRQVFSDGVYFEQSTCYQRYTVDIYLHFLILAQRNEIVLPGIVAERIQQMLDYLLAVRKPNGMMPQIGDSDGGRLMPLMHRQPEDFCDVFAVAAALFGRTDYAWAASGQAPEMVWLLGPSKYKDFIALNPAPPAQAPSRYFPEGGYAIMQGSWKRDTHQLIFDVGPLGCPLSGGHGHADLLSIQCSAFGEPQLMDSGTYCYTAHANWRNYFRGTAAHSTVMIDKQDQATPAGPFSWHRRPRARLRRWLSTAEYDFADADHDAYQGLKDPVMHRRRIFFVKPRYWVLVDDLQGAGVHEVELRFQFGSTHVTLGSDDWACSWGEDGRGLLIRPFSASPLEAEIREGRIEPIEGWISTDYGLRQPAPVLSYSACTSLPLRIVTLLLPSDGASAAPPVITPVMTDQSTYLVFEQEKESIRVDAKDIVVLRG